MSQQNSVEAESAWIRQASGTVAFIGFWILLSPILFTGTGWMIITNVLLGAAIATVASYNVYRMADGESASAVVSLLLVLLALGVIAVPFVPQFTITTPVLYWSNVVAGALVAILGGYTVYGGVKGTGATATTA